MVLQPKQHDCEQCQHCVVVLHIVNIITPAGYDLNCTFLLGWVHLAGEDKGRGEAGLLSAWTLLLWTGKIHVLITYNNNNNNNNIIIIIFI